MTPLELFKLGYDTLAIAGRLKITEAEAYNRLHKERVAERWRQVRRDDHAAAKGKKIVVRRPPLPALSEPRDVTFRRVGSAPVDKRNTSGFAPVLTSNRADCYEDHYQIEPVDIDECDDLLKEWGVQ